MWQHGMRSGGDKNITMSSCDRFYPAKADMISDQPLSDSGGNFGRLARSRIMDEYMEGIRREKLSGIPLDAWQKFLSLFREDRSEESIMRDLDRLTAEAGEGGSALSADDVGQIRAHLLEVVKILEGRRGKAG
jgi:hypothetical protein